MAIPRIAPYPLPEINHPPVVDWPLNPERSALLIHDMQNYFISAYAAEQDPIRSVIPHIRGLIDAADAAGIPVFYSAQPPRQQTARRGLLSDFWGPGIQTDQEAAIIPELAPKQHHHVVTKWRYSALTRTDLRQSLAFSGRDQLLITGVYGHMGCQVSAVDAFMNDVAPFLVGDAIADFTAEDHRQTLDWVSRRCGRVIGTAEALAAWQPDAASISVRS
ncbi:Vibriobactin-specific isochorismatase [Corynebacterium occultum]|uniref:Vibriobactin-specific isochorismatase n=1 Tax=Corynebacterium occultum TaxID=2675219 RepID=A0A6B8W6A5_9CORY|nr:isochorismatase family protein [Corynebacterium occultum]QGU06426.1 Vibriobactin-specific isochorismatase [Corynebacterium occultum]